MDSYRTFIAIELPQEVRDRVIQHITRLREKFPDISASWNRDDSLHLTLKFLGDIPASRIPALSDAVATAAARHAPFTLSVAGCGSFPPRGKPKVLWIGIEDPSEGLSRLHQELETNCEGAGFSREARPFHPHLTIARCRKPKGARQLADLHRSLGFAPQSLTVTEIVGFRSDLLSQGARHTALFCHSLRKVRLEPQFQRK